MKWRMPEVRREAKEEWVESAVWVKLEVRWDAARAHLICSARPQPAKYVKVGGAVVAASPDMNMVWVAAWGASRYF